MAFLDQTRFNYAHPLDEFGLWPENNVLINDEDGPQQMTVTNFLSLIGLSPSLSEIDLVQALKHEGVALVPYGNLDNETKLLSSEEITGLLIDLGSFGDQDNVRLPSGEINPEVIMQLEHTLRHFQVAFVEVPPTTETIVSEPVKLKRHRNRREQLETDITHYKYRLGAAISRLNPLQQLGLLTGAGAAALAVVSPNPAEEVVTQTESDTTASTLVVPQTEAVEADIEAIQPKEFTLESRELTRDKVAIDQALADYYAAHDKFFPDLGVSQAQIQRYRQTVVGSYNGNFTRDGVKDFIIEEAAAGNITKAEDYEMVAEMFAAGELVRIPVQTQFNDRVGIRVGQVGLANHEIRSVADRDRNDDRALFLRPDTAQNMAEVADRLEARLEAAGMPDGWGVRMTVPGLIRPEELRRRVANSSPFSPHLYGLGYDFSRVTFELTYGDHYGTYNLGRDQADHPEAVAILQVADYLLAQTLAEFHEEGSLTLTIERRPPHYHLTNRTLN
jgi:hypothetical protein